MRRNKGGMLISLRHLRLYQNNVDITCYVCDALLAWKFDSQRLQKVTLSGFPKGRELHCGFFPSIILTLCSIMVSVLKELAKLDF